MKSGGWEAVLFDLDGTLADTVELILRCFRHTMEVHLGASPGDEAWLRTLGTPLTEQFKDFARSPEEARDMLDTYVSFQREVHDEAVLPYDGVVELVEELAASGLSLGVVTSKRSEMARRTLEVCGLTPHFSVLVCADEVERAKPHPEPVEKALVGLGSPEPGRVLFVGDSPFDVLAGRGAGVRTAAVLWGPFAREVLEEAGPDFLVASLDELRGLSVPETTPRRRGPEGC